MFLLEQGLLKLLRLDRDGHEVITGLRAAGWLVGAAAAITKGPHAATAVTAAGCRISHLSADEFRTLLWTDPAFSWRVHEMHGRELDLELTQLADVVTLSARRRLEQFLMRLAPAAPSSAPRAEIRLQLPIRQWELANLLAVTPQYLCQMLGQMEREGLLRRERDLILLARAAPRPLSSRSSPAASASPRA